MLETPAFGDNLAGLEFGDEMVKLEFGNTAWSWREGLRSAGSEVVGEVL